MADDYNKLADTYHETKENLIKQYSEEPTFLQAVGDVAGKSVLDIACGDGYYTRIIKRMGAARVVGVDLAAEMIARAQAMEEAEPLDIEYRTQDITGASDLDRFDIVTAVFLFSNAASQDILQEMCRAASKHLVTGGRLVGVTLNPNMTTQHIGVLEQYGASISANGPLLDGSLLTITIDTPTGPFELANYLWRRKTYEEVFLQAGLRTVDWHPMQVSAAGVARYGEEFWQPYLAHPALTVFAC